MAVSDSSSSLNDNENDSILTGSVYSSSEVTEDDSSSVASLSLSVGIIRPYCFEPERPVELEASSSSETEEFDDHPSEERLGNTTWYVNQIYVESTDSTNLATNAVFYVSLKVFSAIHQVHVWLLQTNANGKGIHLLPRNRADESIVGG